MTVEIYGTDGLIAEFNAETLQTISNSGSFIDVELSKIKISDIVRNDMLVFKNGDSTFVFPKNSYLYFSIKS